MEIPVTRYGRILLPVYRVKQLYKLYRQIADERSWLYSYVVICDTAIYLDCESGHAIDIVVIT